tara:strand:- start:474 stop:725 length:252 start_codon:yes stop_codon:yes gene_type:complete
MSREIFITSLELEKKNVNALEKELEKAKEDLDWRENWIIEQWYTMIEEYLHGADNWREEIKDHEISLWKVSYIKKLIKEKRGK